mmetsp:Transcript_97938/g.261416  ORF Transcript_97938/g.261416 Transcript_97938/m.261416 type:complete len:249 (-) Transcript_97938:60-806(-)
MPHELPPTQSTHSRRPLHAQHVRLPPGLHLKLQTLPRLDFCRVDVGVAVDWDWLVRGALAGHWHSQVGPPTVPLGGSARLPAAVVGLQAGAIRHEPHLDESQWLLRVMVEFGVPHPCPRRHKLYRPPPERLLRPHGVLMCQLPADDVRHDLHVAVRVCSKSAGGLDQVVVHHTEHTEAGPLRVAVFRERKMKPALQPVPVRPGRLLLVPSIAEQMRRRLRHVQGTRGDHHGHGDGQKISGPRGTIDGT